MQFHNSGGYSAWMGRWLGGHSLRGKADIDNCTTERRYSGERLVTWLIVFVVYVHTHAGAGSEDNLLGSVLSLHHLGHRDQLRW